MSSIAHMKLLVNLARIDGKVADREKQFILNIAGSQGIEASEVTSWFESAHETVVPTHLTDDEKFEFIFSMTQLMKVDERMYREEILFCSRIAAKLGYDQQVMFDLMLQVKTPKMSADEIEALKPVVQKYLKNSQTL